MTEAMDLAKTLDELSKAATQGEWESDSEYDNDALYSGGGGCGRGFKNYFISTDVDGKWKTLLDTADSDHKLIDEEYDEDGTHAWDTIGAYRTGKLVVVDADAIRTQPYPECDDYIEVRRDERERIIAALKGADQ